MLIGQGMLNWHTFMWSLSFSSVMHSFSISFIYALKCSYATTTKLHPETIFCYTNPPISILITPDRTVGCSWWRCVWICLWYKEILERGKGGRSLIRPAVIFLSGSHGLASFYILPLFSDISIGLNVSKMVALSLVVYELDLVRNFHTPASCVYFCCSNSSLVINISKRVKHETCEICHC